MKHIKTYEDVYYHYNYVLVDPNGIRSEPTGRYAGAKDYFHNFINDNVGYVEAGHDDIVTVSYPEPPFKLKRFFMYQYDNYVISIRTKKIISYSKNKEDIEALISSKNYNL